MKLTRWTHLLLLGSSLATATARAQSAPPVQPPAAERGNKQEAARRFEHAIKLYEDGDYALALAEFERVYELVPDYRVLYNIGQVNIQLGRYARALRSLREYVSRGGDELPPDRRSAVQADLDLLQTRTASVTLVIRPEGAEVSIDGVVIGKSPLAEAVVVDVGERTVQARLAGHVTRTQTLTLAGGDRREVALELEPERAAVVPPTVAPSARPSPAVPHPSQTRASTAEHKPSWLWAGWTATGALAVSSAVSAALGASAVSDLNAQRDSREATRASLDDAKSRAQTRLLVADILGVAAVATGATTLYFQLSSSSATDRPNAPTRVGLGIAPGGVTLRLEH
jgi:hypothetical protein